MRSRSDPMSDEFLRSTCFAQMVLNHIKNPRRKIKMIDICCDGSSMKYHSLSYWSIVMMSLVEFSTGEFRAKQVRKKSFKMT